MNRWVVAIAVPILSFSFSTRLTPPNPRLIFEGRVADQDGRPVAGAEIKIFADAAGRKYRVFSDLQGLYQSPIIEASRDQAELYRIEISHLRYQPVLTKDAMRGVVRSGHGVPDQSGRPHASKQVVRRDFVMEPSRGTPQQPALGPLDPNYAEYCYQQAQLFIGRNQPKEAVEYLKIYAQIGGNPKQVARSLQLIAEHDKQP